MPAQADLTAEQAAALVQQRLPGACSHREIQDVPPGQAEADTGSEQRSAVPAVLPDRGRSGSKGR